MIVVVVVVVVDVVEVVIPCQGMTTHTTCVNSLRMAFLTPRGGGCGVLRCLEMLVLVVLHGAAKSGGRVWKLWK